MLISDEPYRELAYDGAVVPYVTKYYANTVVCYSYSKSLSLPGERIGYLVIPNELTDSKEVFTAATIANRVIGCVNAPSLIQRVIKRCIEKGAAVNLSAYDKNRNLLYNSLKEFGFECIRPRNTICCWYREALLHARGMCGLLTAYLMSRSSVPCRLLRQWQRNMD